MSTNVKNENSKTAATTNRGITAERAKNVQNENGIDTNFSGAKKFQAQIHRYPNNLGQDEQPHSLNIFISQYVPGGAKQAIAERNASAAKELGVAGPRTGNEVTSENAQNFGNAVRAGIVIGGGVTAGSLAASKVPTGFKTLAALGVGAAAGATVNKIAQEATSVNPPPALRIKDVIQLHISQSPQAKYGATFENEAVGTLLGTLGQGGDFKSAIEKLTDGTGSDLLSRGLAELASIPKEFGLGSNDFGTLARATSKKVRNPYQEQIFKSMNFRNFAFQYKFAPRNNSEFDSVMSIIDLLKFHMHPEKDPGGAFFVFPSVFDLEYRYKDTRNNFVNKIATSVLTDLSVDYGSEGVFTTFRGTKGKPSEITVAMNFREISLLTKDINSGQLTNGSGTGY